MPESEFLTAEELAEITGYKHPGSQKEWLDANGWKYVMNAARRPIVGRWFARMRLAAAWRKRQPKERGHLSPAWTTTYRSRRSACNTGSACTASDWPRIDTPYIDVCLAPGYLHPVAFNSAMRV